MIRFNKILIFPLIVNHFIIGEIFCQSSQRFQVKDKIELTPIPYAYIKVLHKSVLETADENGFFSLNTSLNDTIQISQVAYNTIKIPFKILLKNSTVLLEPVTKEVDAVIISAKDTRRLLDRAIKNNYESIKTLKNVQIFRRDLIQFRDTNVIEAFAEINFEIKDLLLPGHSGILKAYLKNIIVNKNNNFNRTIVPLYNMEATFLPINIFIFGSFNNPEKYIYFNKQDLDDSLLIIHAYPKLNFDPNNKYLVKNGICVISKKTGRIKKIETSLNDQMLAFNRNEKYRFKDSKRFFFFYYFEENFDPEGSLSRVFWDYKYSYLENDTNRIWRNCSEIKVTKKLDKPKLEDAICILKNDTSLVQMKSNFKPGFEETVLKMFRNNIQSIK